MGTKAIINRFIPSFNLFETNVNSSKKKCIQFYCEIVLCRIIFTITVNLTASLKTQHFFLEFL